MSFLDNVLNLFRPKWKHSDPEKRAEAVRQLDEGDARVLAEVARHDAAPHVRRLALKKIADPALLADIGQSEADEALRRFAAEKAEELMVQAATGDDDDKAHEALGRVAAPRALAEVAKTAPSESVRRAAIARIGDERALADVARSARDPATRRLAVERLQDANALRDVAIHDAAREVALAAVEKIVEAAALEQVARRGKNKAVRDAARERLPQAMGKVPLLESQPASAPPEARRQARRLQLSREAERAAALPELAQAEEVLAALQREWDSLGGEGAGDADAKKRLERAGARIGQRKRAIDDQRRAAAAVEEQRKEHEAAQVREQAARVALIEKVEALDGEGMRDRIEGLREEWQALGRLPHGGELVHRFRKACDAAQRRADLAISRDRLRERMEALAVEADEVGAAGTAVKEAEAKLRGLQKRWRDLEAAGSDEALKARMVAAEQRVTALRAAEQERRQAEEEAATARLEELCGRIEALVSTDDRKTAEGELKVVQAAFESVHGRGPRIQAARDRFAAARDRLSARLTELREAENWKRWANVPKLEKLCERMEALKEQGDLKAAAAELKALQAEWKTVGAAPKEKSEALWQRFKAAGDEVYRRTHEGFEKLEAERGENLKKKEELCTRAEALADFDAGRAEPPPPAEWKEQADKFKALQEEWKKVGPAPKDQADAVWKRFRAACDRFFDRRKEQFGRESEERTENLKILDDLCARAEAIVEAALTAEGRPGLPPRWKESADAIKKLQADWRSVGPAPRDASEAAWKRFRQACDRFFERRKATFEKHDEERTANLRKKEELCARAEQLADSPDRETAMREAKALQAEWKRTGQAPKEHADAIWRRFRAACDRIFDRGDRGRASEGDEAPPPTPEEQEKIKAYGKFENKLPLEGVLAQLKVEKKGEEAAPAPEGSKPPDTTSP